MSPRDLAPGDARSAALDLAQFDVFRIRSAEDPLFAPAYAQLWEEFGPRHEMERRKVLARRFALAPALLYEMALVRKDGVFAAVRDHTALRAGEEAIVHLSHNLVAPEWRRTGLAGWMRALPLLAARENFPGAPVTLVAEMEYESPDDAACAIRLMAYEKAGFKKIDPRVVRYHQPDFRAPKEIDRGGGARPLPFQLVIRRVDREHEDVIGGAQVREIAAALHAMYARQFRAADMRHPALDIADLPATPVALIAPSASC